VPVIVCTAATLVASDRAELLAMGVVAILAKPFDVEELIALVGQHIPSGRGSQALSSPGR
jgi:DNA-binding response OmpR family regulator